METPNTRARRKREVDASQEESSVIWGRDDTLSREFMIAGPSDKPVPLPSPTQRPRPITASTSTGTHPRKRTRTRMRSASSVPPRADETGKRLDELLERYIDASSRPGSCASTPNTSSLSTISTNSAKSRQPMTDRQAVNGATPVSSTRSLPPKAAPQYLSSRRTVSSTDLKQGAKPTQRHGFRPPFLNPPPPGVRSSPRRAAAAAAMVAVSPLRAPVAASPLAPKSRPPAPSSSRMLSGASQSATSQPQRVPPARAAATRSAPTPPVPQPSSDGDTSIDSFDGFFENGGAEMDDLFAAMDGRK